MEIRLSARAMLSDGLERVCVRAYICVCVRENSERECARVCMRECVCARA